ncbi:MAG: hypothetical protein ACD_56C00023G0003 [uncultured bacterium]|nr:MAG: hypothetical protein ACD_56C00023G0003 [uncultured bacterium]
MNSKTYHGAAKDISKKLNDHFGKFCEQYPQYSLIKEDYTKKPIHLNGVQFYAGFVSGPFENWEDYMEIAIAIEIVMLWAYKTKYILDKKQETWDKEENVMGAVLQHDLMLSCIHDLLDVYTQKELRYGDKVRVLISEMVSKLSYGFWVEKTKLNIHNLSEQEVRFEWEKNYIDRNNSLNLVYDYAPLVGFALSSGNFEIINDYLKAIPAESRFSHASQLISDLGNFGDELDKNASSNQDVFADIRNGIVTFPIYKLMEENEIKEALENSEITKGKVWQNKVTKLIIESDVNKEAIQIAAKSYNLHKNFFESYLSDPSQMLLKIFGMLINNKYFNQKIVFDESPLLRSFVVLCDKKGKEVGTYDKLRAQKEGLMYKTFSIFIYNSKGEHLVQKRSDNQPHSVGLWSNTYSSHCISGEKLLVTAKRKLKEELGIEAELEKRFSFSYKIHTDNGLTEEVYDTVLIGKYDGEIILNPMESKEARWMNIEDLANDIKINPRTYTDWFRIILERMGYR